MSHYRFQLATRTDDGELRKILAATPMAGRISVSFQREPSFFDAAVVDGDFRQIVICRETDHDKIVGFGSRSIREMSVNGQPVPVGYLSNLRVLPQYRNMGLIARGYAYFRSLHADGRTDFYLTTIADGNDTAMSVLTSGRARLPTYLFLEMYHTTVIPIVHRRRASTAIPPSLQVRPATDADWDCVLQYMRTVGPARQFFPCYQKNEFDNRNGGATFKDFKPADLLLAFRDQRLVGTLGCWNQSRFRRSIVEGYSSHLRWSRPVYNMWASLCGRPKLPKPGEPFRYLNAALPVILNNDLEVFEALLQSLLSRAVNGPFDYLLVGLSESDPLLPTVLRYRTQSYVTRAYVVCWDDPKQLAARLDGRPLYLELGCL